MWEGASASIKAYKPNHTAYGIILQKAKIRDANKNNLLQMKKRCGR